MAVYTGFSPQMTTVDVSWSTAIPLIFTTSVRQVVAIVLNEEQDHVALLALLEGLPFSVILSAYPSSLYDERLPDWRTLELQVTNQGGIRTEKLWFNFLPPSGFIGPATRARISVIDNASSVRRRTG